MHEEIIHGLTATQLEWVCGGIIREIAEDYGEDPEGPPELMAPTHDGGIEAKVRTRSGYLAVQCKSYSDFAGEIRDVKKSFSDFLKSPEHSGVNRYIWCSTSRRTSGTGPREKRKTGNDSKAENAIQCMHDEAATVRRDVSVDILFADDLDRILRERRPEYFTVISARSPLRHADIDNYSEWQASRILSRLGSDATPQITFPTQSTELFLDQFVASSRSPQEISTASIKELFDETVRRARSLPLDRPAYERLATSTQSLRNAASHLIPHPILPASDAAPHLQQLLNAAETALQDATDILESTSSSTSSNADDTISRNSTARFAKSMIAVCEEVEKTYCMANALLSRRLLITGRWGTGKSYQLATLTRRAQEAGAHVLLLRGRDMTRPDAPILSQPWRNGFDNENADAAVIAAMLDSVAHHSDYPLFIIIDGLNESSLQDHLPMELRHLGEMIQRFPNLRLILSSRRDRMDMAEDSLPELVHESPDRVTMARSVELALQVRPGTRWHAALTNPLLASIAVLVLSARPEASERLLSRTALFDAWVDLLAQEASTALGLSPATIVRVIDALGKAGGEHSIIDLAARAQLHSDRVDGIVQRLADDGLLESGSPTRDTVRFRWEAVNDMLQIRQAIQANRLDSYLADRDEDHRFALSILAAELLPKERPSLELPDLKLSSITPEESNLMFALSLGSRGDQEITSRTQRLAEHLLAAGGEVSELIVASVLGMPHREKLGAAWFNMRLRTTPLNRRDQFWPRALESLCDGSQFDQKNLESLLGWYASGHWKALTDHDIETAIELLSWIGCAAISTGLPEIAVCSLVEILHRHPTSLQKVLEHFHDIDDDHPRDALLTAAAGVTARWPKSSAAGALRHACSRILSHSPRPHSYRSFAAIHVAIGSELPMHKFLVHSLPPLTARRPLRSTPHIDEDDRGMFADGRDPHEATVFESRILSTLGSTRKLQRLLSAEKRNESVYGHVGSLVFGRWLARQYAYHRTGERIFSWQHGVIKAGTAENPARDFLKHPQEAWDFFVDPTVPLDLLLRADDTVHPETWWALRSVPTTGSASDLRVTAPDGVAWIVIDGLFRLLSPVPARASGPTLRIGRSHWAIHDEDDGRPRPGHARHEVIHVDNATLSPHGTVPGELKTALGGRARFADSFSIPSDDGEMVSTRLDGNVDPPTADALELLNARWTGEGLDCVDPSGVLVITDPAAGLAAPHAVLVREDALVSALERTGQRLTIRLKSLNNLLRDMSGSETHTIVLGGR